MIESTSGLILRTRPLTETSLIVHWLTPDLGRVATVAKGARRPKSPFAGKLDLFFEADFSFQRSRRSELHALREVSLRGTHPAIREDLARLEQAAYAAALIEQTTEVETPLPEIHALLSGFLDFVASSPAMPRSVFAFELKLLRLLGLEPDLPETRLSEDACVLVSALLESKWDGLAVLQASASQARALNQFLHGFLIYHLGKFPPSRRQALSTRT